MRLAAAEFANVLTQLYICRSRVSVRVQRYHCVAIRSTKKFSKYLTGSKCSRSPFSNAVATYGAERGKQLRDFYDGENTVDRL